MAAYTTGVNNPILESGPMPLGRAVVFERRLSLVNGCEQGLVQILVTQPAIKALDEGVLCWFAMSDKPSSSPRRRAPFHTAVEGFFDRSLKPQLKRCIFRSVLDLQSAAHQALAEINRLPEAFPRALAHGR